MNSTLSPGTGGPDAVLSARADERLAHAYEQITRADEQLARVTEHLSRMERGTARHPAVAGRPRTSPDKPVLRGLVGLMLAALICAAALAAHSSYGEAARGAIAEFVPGVMSAAPQWAARPANSAPGPSPLQLAAVDATAAPSPPATPGPAQDAATAPAAPSPELTQLLQAMARDIAAVQQGIEQLKANQERMAADNARAIEQLRASQPQQMVHPVVAKQAEPDAHARTQAPAPHPVATAARKPPPKPPVQAQAKPRAPPIQLQPDEQ